MAGTKYLKTEGVLTYGAQNINDLDSASQEAIKNSDRHTVNSDGTISFIDSDGSEQLMPVGTDQATVDLSAIDPDLLQKAADLTYLSQNTGVRTSDMNALYVELGLDPNDSMAFTKKDAILKAAGYNPGDQVGFYGNNQAKDVGAQILNERWQKKPTEQDMIDAGLDPSNVSVLNSNIASAAYLAQELANRGADTSSTSAYIGTDAMTRYQEGKKLLEDVISSGSPNSYWNQKMQSTGSSLDDLQLDMLEWDLIKKKAETTRTDRSTATGITTGGAGGTGGTGGVSSGYTISGDSLGIPDSAVIPTLTPSQISSGASGNYTVPAQTFEKNLTDQATDFQNRAVTNQQYVKPQTVSEKAAAGQDVSAYAISQKLYRNPQTGDQRFITFQGNQPLAPIPAGYYEVNQSTGTFGQQNVFNPITAGGNTYTAAAQGGYIQGFAGEDGSYVVPSSFDPNQVYGDVSFQDPVTGQTITQTPEEYFQSLGNKQAQATFNPASSVTMPGVATMSELGYVYNADGTIATDPTTGQPLTQELMPGTVIESTAGQASGMAPVVGKYQARDAEGNLMFDAQGQPVMVGTDPAQVTNVTQAKGPGTPAVYDDQGNLISAAVEAPGAAQASLTQAAPGVSQQLQGGTTTDYAGMAATVPGAVWDVATGTFKVGDQTFTPDEFVAANGINVGNFMTTTGGLQAATMSDLTQTVTGQTQDTSTIADLTAETGSAQTVADVAGEAGLPTRTLDTTEGASELITGTGVDQSKVGEAFGTGEVQAASVQDELTGLMAQFEGGETPAWASGAMRKATQMLAARGLGASSMAGQAVIQAAMEAALPIAQIDAGNKQQMALFKAEQRAKFLGMEFDQAFQTKVINAAKVSEIANMNFSAEQQIALENSRAANTMDLQNLSNKQALIMAEAAALGNLDLASLNNLQQAQVQNAQNFLQLDMANLSNEQSTALFKAQQITNAMLSDTAQANATAQFNATSENQTNQFFSNLAAQISQFNAAQQNAINQFNAEEVNALLEFNAALQNQREMFNAQNYLVVAQANAQWRQNINTANTEAQNVANLTYAKEVNGLTQKALDDYWQKERDIMSYAFASSESAADRALKLLLGEQNLTAVRERLAKEENAAKAEFFADMIFGDFSFTDLFK